MKRAKNWKEITDEVVREHGREAVIAFLSEVGLNDKLTNAKLEESKFWENQIAIVMSLIYLVPEKFRPSGRAIWKRIN